MRKFNFSRRKSPQLLLAFLAALTTVFGTAFLISQGPQILGLLAVNRTATLSLAVSEVTVQPGERFVVPISLSTGNQPIIGMDAVVEFDRTKVSLEEVAQSNNVFQTYLPSSPNSTSILDTVQVVADANSTGKVVFGASMYDFSRIDQLSPYNGAIYPVATLTFVPVSNSGTTTIKIKYDGEGLTTDSNVVILNEQNQPEDILAAPTSQLVVNIGSTSTASVTPRPVTPQPTPFATRTPIASLTPRPSNLATPRPSLVPTPLPTIVPPQGSTIKIFAAGTAVTGVYPTMVLSINDIDVATFTNVQGNVSTRQFREYTYTHSSLVQSSNIKVKFTNDAYIVVEDRNLVVDKIVVDGVVLESENSSTYSEGGWDDATRCAPGYKRTEQLSCNGYFKYAQSTATSIPVPVVTPRPTTATFATPQATANSGVLASCVAKEAYRDVTSNVPGKYNISSSTYMNPGSIVRPGQVFVYYVEGKQLTGTTSGNVVWRDTLDSRLTFLDGEGCVVYDASTRQVRCNQGVVESGDDHSFYFRVRVDSQAVLGDLINTATVRTNGANPNSCSIKLRVSN